MADPFDELIHRITALTLRAETAEREREEAREELASNRRCNLFTWKERAEKAEARSAALYEALCGLQWCAAIDWFGGYCPMCGRPSSEGHNAVCVLSALLNPVDAPISQL